MDISDIELNAAVPLYSRGFGSRTTRPQPSPPVVALAWPGGPAGDSHFLNTDRQECIGTYQHKLKGRHKQETISEDTIRTTILIMTESASRGFNSQNKGLPSWFSG